MVVTRNAAFKPSFDKIIIRMMETGYFLKWKQNAVAETKKSKMKNRVETLENSPLPLGLDLKHINKKKMLLSLV